MTPRFQSFWNCPVCLASTTRVLNPCCQYESENNSVILNEHDVFEPFAQIWLETSHLQVCEGRSKFAQMSNSALSSLMEMFQRRRYESTKSTLWSFTLTVCWFRLIRRRCWSVMHICLDGSWFVPPRRSVSTPAPWWILWISTLASANEGNIWKLAGWLGCLPKVCCLPTIPGSIPYPFHCPTYGRKCSFYLHLSYIKCHGCIEVNV